MADTVERTSTRTFWLGVLCAVASLLSNSAFFVKVPGLRVISWLSLVLVLVALVLLGKGLREAFSGSLSGLRRTGISIALLVSLLLAAVTVFAFFHSRDLPASLDAPRVGQRVPDFTLPDTSGQPVSLAQLFEPQGSGAQPPKTVLLIFYRGYW